MSARDELPPCRCIDYYPGSYLHDECRSCRALGTLKITREEYTTMRAAVERCAELETALARVTAERDQARDEAGTWRRYAHTEDRGYLREVGAAAEFPWERATPTEGE